MKQMYSRDDLDRLNELSGELPLPLLVVAFNKWAKANGRPIRSEGAIRMKLLSLGLNMEPVGEYVRTGLILSALGCTQQKIERWVRYGWIKPVIRPRETSTGERPPRRSFRRSDLRSLARDHPEAFAGATRAGLWLLLEDHDLVEMIRKNHPVRLNNELRRVPVMCVETRQRYSSVYQAAKAHGVSASAIRNALKRNHRAHGLHWQELKPLNPSTHRQP